MRVSLVHNPAARAGTAPNVEALVALVRAAGHDVTPYTTGSPGWAAALQDPGDLLVLAGGDGTVAAALRAIAAAGGSAAPATILPVGTANNVANALGLVGALSELIGGWPAMQPRDLDVGVVAGRRTPPRLFVEAAGVGVLTDMIGALDGEARRLNAAIRRHEGKRGYVGLLGTMLPRAPVRRLRLVVDGRDLSGDYLLVEVLNVGMVGPNLALAPQADPGDGLLDLLLVEERSRGSVEDWLAARARGSSDGIPIPTLRVRELEIEAVSGRRLRIRRDDEVGVHRGRLTISLRAGALRVLAPGR